MNPQEKAYKIPGDQIRELIPAMGGCMATDRITVDGQKVGYMYREEPEEPEDDDDPVLTGWTFMAGDEDEDYADDPDNWAIYEVNTICNYDPAIIPYLKAPYDTAFGRVEGTDEFEEEPLDDEDEDEDD